ncbi:MAG: sigma-54 dependent transcriptional regulator [Proteobacteria bacterium]|nr:sigma-54 dependent transcriptional regulator [Pseudomonadota bacterium]
MKGRIIIVDDDRSLREMLEIILKREDYDVIAFDSADSALDWLKINIEEVDVIISDIIMPKIDGISFLEKIKEINKEIPVIMITANTRVDYAIEALKRGAYDYVTKPFNNDELKIIIKNAVEKKNLESELMRLRSLIDNKQFPIIFSSKIMEDLYLKAISIAKTNSTVLITGESGTGKELFARLIHNESDRKNGPFFPVNCGAIPENLMESELFGYEKGAFTGAMSSKLGFFELANNGTIFLDEIAELPLTLQVKLLRVLEDRMVLRLGGKSPVPTDIRVISATNKDIEELVKNGDFREDLYYRLNVVRIKIPPLRERREDIIPLSMHFLKKCSQSHNKTIKGITKDATSFLEAYDYPGNVRELQNIIERACVFETGELLGVGSLPLEILGSSKTTDLTNTKAEDVVFSNFNLDKYMEDIEKKIIEKALEETKGNKKDAAELLGISLWALYHRLEKYKK